MIVFLIHFLIAIILKKRIILLFKCQIRRLMLNTGKKGIILRNDARTRIYVLHIKIACRWHEQFTILFDFQSRFFNFIIYHLIELNHWYLYIFLLLIIDLIDNWRFFQSAFIVFLFQNVAICSANIQTFLVAFASACLASWCAELPLWKMIAVRFFTWRV